MVTAGCGGGSSSHSLTKAEFLRKGDALCKKINDGRSAAIQIAFAKARKQGRLPAAKKVTEEIYVSALLAPLEQEADELSELGVPKGEEDEENAIVEGLEKAIEKSKKNPDRAFRPNADPFSKVAKRAKEYGFEVCAQY